MRAVLADADVAGVVNVLVSMLEKEPWREFWASLGLAVYTFEDLGLNRNAPDRLIWRTCQSQETVLVTANRNSDGPDSLEATIRSENSLSSLPVLTISNAQQFHRDKEYASRVARRILEILMDMEYFRG